MKKIIIILTCIFFIVALGVYLGITMYDNNENEYNQAFDNNMIIQEENIEIPALETSNLDQEKTTPNTLIIYKTYYTK